MTIDTFTHLHLHTEFSLLDGAIRIRDLPDRLAELGMKACAITDHGVMYGVIDFYNALVSKGIKPIIGCEVYVAPRSHTDKEVSHDKEPAHLVLLAENKTGYQNLMRLVSAGFTEGFYYRPRIDKALLRQHAEGLIGLSACLGGEIPQALMMQDPARARELACQMDEIFGRGNFFLELQSNQIPAQNLVNSALIQISRETGIPLIATGDCHYSRKEDAKAHEILLCMQTAKRMSDSDRMRMETEEFYIKSPAEMAEAFAAVPEALENTMKVASRCDVTLEFNVIHLPSFEVPDGASHEEYLLRLCRDGLDERLELPTNLPRQEYERRLEYELSVINQMKYTDYYLIVWDFIRFARSRGIMVGPGRGSGAGSLAAYCLGITSIDPLQYALIFERFLNSERVSMPDFDIDFCYERRQEVIDYVTEKYGQDRVAQVITFGTLAARAVIRDVARALDVPYAETDRIAKLVPQAPGITIRKALEASSELKQEYEQNAATKEVLDTAMLFEGMPRHASTHAAGVVISNQPLTDLAPLSRNEDAIVVQFAKNNVELIGLLKFDFLGLRTLTVLRDTAELALKNHGDVIDYNRMPMNDPAVFDMISNGDTEAVFQLESPGMTSFMKDLKPESPEDLVAGISLFRPGPMEQIPRYVAAKHDPSKIHYDHPLLEPILNVTYGCMVYQEQVMQIVRDLAGFSMGQSDNVRRAMSKKKPAEMAKYKGLFLHGGADEKGRQVPGAVAQGVSIETAEKIFDDVMAFAGYAFPKGHAASYAVVAYQTAWLKIHYPVEFMAAMLNSYLGSLSQAAWYVRVCKKMGINVLPPHINLSSSRFATEEGQIRFSLAAVKNVGAAAIRQLISEREANGPFRSFGDFLRRMSEGELNKKMIESLIRSSAMDCFGVPRSKMIAVLDPFINQILNARRQNMAGQLSLFEFGTVPSAVDAEPDYPNIPEFGHADLLGMEKEMLGLYVSGHPLDEYEGVMKLLTTLDSSSFAHLHDEAGDGAQLQPAAASDGDKVIMGGMLIGRKNKTTRSNDLMSFLTVEDLFSQYEVIVFPKTLTAFAEILREGEVLLFGGRLSIREDEEPKLVAEMIGRLDKNADRLPPGFDFRPFRQTAQAGSGRPTARPAKATYQEMPEYPETGASPDDAGGPLPEPPPEMTEDGFSLPDMPNEEELSEPEVNGAVLADLPASNNQNGGVAAAGGHAPGTPTLLIRYFGQSGDPGYRRLLAMLQYFRGTTPVQVYLAASSQTISLPHTCWVEFSDEILSRLAKRYGSGNLAVL